MQEDNEKRIDSLQEFYFGRDYRGARLNRVSIGTDGSKNVVNWLRKKSDILLFMGSPGVGKTYFCSALIPWVDGKYNSIRAWNEQQFLSKLREGISDGYDFHKEIEYRTDDDFMIYDDLGSASPSDWKVDVIFTIIDIRYRNRLPTVITTNLTEEEIKATFGVRTHSRLFDKRNLILNLHGSKDKRQDESRGDE